MPSAAIHYRFVPRESFTLEMAIDCSALFGGHYGSWDTTHNRAGEPVRFPVNKLYELARHPNGFVLVAYAAEDLVGYALGAHFPTTAGPVSWVTQLVVHTDYRNQKIASTLLGSAWCFSDSYAWGIVSANPLAIRALERATRRLCDPRVISANLHTVKSAFSTAPDYLRNAGILAGPERSIANTDFRLCHALVPQLLIQATQERSWSLGQLLPSQEWLGVTFASQPRAPFVADEFKRLEAASAEMVAEAYNRMAGGALQKKHPWMKHTASEVDFILEKFRLSQGASILDLGCGSGRHAIELAKRGYRVTAVDSSPAWLEIARRNAEQAAVSVRFIEADARHFELEERYDAGLALYDVIGSYPADNDNALVAKTLAKHLVPGGAFALSVMNRRAGNSAALISAIVAENPDILLTLPASTQMETDGNIWSKSAMIADPSTGVFYRRERFLGGEKLPTEFIVRDRRYYPEEIADLCSTAGLYPSMTRTVHLGRWHEENSADSTEGKEILCLGNTPT